MICVIYKSLCMIIICCHLRAFFFVQCIAKSKSSRDEENSYFSRASKKKKERVTRSQRRKWKIWAMETTMGLGMGKSEIRAIAENMLDVRGKTNVRARRP